MFHDFPRSRLILSQAIPDVSALADNFKIFFQGRSGLIGGTSASSPAFAGFVSLLNDVRISNGRPPLGFLNPFIYSIGKSGFNDITVGNNPGCGTPGTLLYFASFRCIVIHTKSINFLGFNATIGWDPGTYIHFGIKSSEIHACSTK